MAKTVEPRHAVDGASWLAANKGFASLVGAVFALVVSVAGSTAVLVHFANSAAAEIVTEMRESNHLMDKRVSLNEQQLGVLTEQMSALQRERWDRADSYREMRSTLDQIKTRMDQ